MVTWSYIFVEMEESSTIEVEQTGFFPLLIAEFPVSHAFPKLWASRLELIAFCSLPKGKLMPLIRLFSPQWLLSQTEGEWLFFSVSGPQLALKGWKRPLLTSELRLGGKVYSLKGIEMTYHTGRVPWYSWVRQNRTFNVPLIQIVSWSPSKCILKEICKDGIDEPLLATWNILEKRVSWLSMGMCKGFEGSKEKEILFSLLRQIIEPRKTTWSKFVRFLQSMLYFSRIT